MIDRTYGHLASDADAYEADLLDAWDSRTARMGAEWVRAIREGADANRVSRSHDNASLLMLVMRNDGNPRRHDMVQDLLRTARARGAQALGRSRRSILISSFRIRRSRSTTARSCRGRSAVRPGSTTR